MSARRTAGRTAVWIAAVGLGWFAFYLFVGPSLGSWGTAAEAVLVAGATLLLIVLAVALGGAPRIAWVGIAFAAIPFALLTPLDNYAWMMAAHGGPGFLTKAMFSLVIPAASMVVGALVGSRLGYRLRRTGASE